MKLSYGLRGVVGCVAALLMLACAEPQTSDEWDAIMQEKAGDLVAQFERDTGATFEVVRIDAGVLSNGESATREFAGTPNGFYVIAGACDDNCSDINLALSDSAGFDLGSDTAPDDYPALDLVTGDESYSYAVSMEGCAARNCEWAAFILRELDSGPGHEPGVGLETWHAQATEVAERYVNRLAQDGVRFEIADVLIGSMWAGEGTTSEVTASVGSTLAVFGICGEDCSDIDLSLRDAAGSVVGSDTEPDDTPLIEVRAEQSTYEVELTMHRCAVGPCEWSIIVLREQ